MSSPAPETVVSEKPTSIQYVQERVLFIPSHYFYTVSVEIPQEMTADRLPSFASMTLEEKSPFSMERLSWGYLNDGRYMLIYAVLTERLRDAGYEKLELFRYALPSFIAIHNHCSEMVFSEVDFPEPVGPVTRIIPWGLLKMELAFISSSGSIPN